MYPDKSSKAVGVTILMSHHPSPHSVPSPGFPTPLLHLTLPTNVTVFPAYMAHSVNLSSWYRLALSSSKTSLLTSVLCNFSFLALILNTFHFLIWFLHAFICFVILLHPVNIQKLLAPSRVQ